MVTVKILGKFEISRDGKTLDDRNFRSNQLVRLLIFLVIYRKRSFSAADAAEALWPEGETDNPSGALKNLVYRLRSLLKKLGDDPFIIHERGSYRWNPAVPLETDYELFEQACLRAQKESRQMETKDCIDVCEKALALYGGSVFPAVAAETWMISTATYYHSLYLRLIKDLCGFYDQTQRYAEMEKVCREALAEDSLDEELHYWLIKALMGQHNQDLALQHYEEAKTILRKNLGLRQWDRLDDIYAEIISIQNLRVASFDDIYQDISEDMEPSGAFLCDYVIFRQIYRLEARRVERLGISEHLALLTLETKSVKKKEEALAMLRTGMERMRGVLSSYLRIGDAACRYSDSQYLLMLPACTYEAGAMVCERLLRRFREALPNPAVQVRYELEEVSAKHVKLK